jgi:hypothetical protein
MSAKCFACDNDLVIIRKGGKFRITCPKGCFTLPADMTKAYTSESQAIDEAERLYALRHGIHDDSTLHDGPELREKERKRLERMERAGHMARH